MSYDIAFQTKVHPILRAAIVSALGSLVAGRVFWLRSQSDVFPQIIFQPQASGSRHDYLGANGWTGPVTFRALALDPGSALYRNNRGVALAALGQVDAARTDFEAALRMDGCLVDARNNLARLGVSTPAPPDCR